NATGPSGAVVTYVVTANDDQDGALAVSCTPPSGSVFAVGSTTVSCTATDAGGNATVITFSVIVKAAGAAAPALPLGALGGLSLLLYGLARRRLRARA
ncbi:MAG TPA: HYR domain-containing protein, partial [Polyangiaceae bacterium]|nr:HYR domain-containing protein [Polyangiaceae bacterium]